MWSWCVVRGVLCVPVVLVLGCVCCCVRPRCRGSGRGSLLVQNPPTCQSRRFYAQCRLTAPPLRSAVLVVLVALLWRSLEVGLTATTPLAPSTGWRSERAAAPQRCFGSRRDWQAPGLTCLQHTVLGAVSQVHGSTDGAAGLCTSGRRTSRGPPGKCESRWSREM